MRRIYVEGKCPCCTKPFYGTISADFLRFCCPVCKGLIPRVFCTESEYPTQSSEAPKLDELPEQGGL